LIQDLSLTILPVKFRKVSENFDIICSNIQSLEGIPTIVGGFFSIDSKSRKFTKKEIREVCHVNYDILV